MAITIGNRNIKLFQRQIHSFSYGIEWFIDCTRYAFSRIVFVSFWIIHYTNKCTGLCYWVLWMSESNDNVELPVYSSVQLNTHTNKQGVLCTYTTELIRRATDIYWNGNVVLMPCSSLATQEVVILTTYGAANGENDVKMTTVPFKCIDITVTIITDVESEWDFSLQWRHNERDVVSNHRRLDCLLNRLFRHR